MKEQSTITLNEKESKIFLGLLLKRPDLISILKDSCSIGEIVISFKK